MAVSQCIVGTYLYTSAKLVPSDARSQEAARRVAETVASIEPRLRLEHVGSTAVPGLAGKGIVDLMLLYPDRMLERARQVLDGLGFQRQTFGDPFPEERPMRVGTVDVDGVELKVHIHVIAEDSHEAHEFLRFRDQLRADSRLRRAYVERKRRLIEAGITESPEYASRKGTFIRAVLDRSVRAD
ncbi:MAG: GrpB family protein [Candidatus Dormibacteria bacterium]